MSYELHYAISDNKDVINDNGTRLIDLCTQNYLKIAFYS